MNEFWTSFHKEAAETESPWKKRLLAAGAGLAGAAGVYAGARRGGTKLLRALHEKAPKSKFMHGLNKIMYGADDLIYTEGRGAPNKAKIYDGHALLTQGDQRHHVRGTKSTIGAITDKESRHLNDKFHESALINKHTPEHHTPTMSANVGKSGHENLKALHKKQKGDYIIKHRSGVATGVGDVALVTRKEIDHHLSGGKLPRHKEKLIRKIKNNPNQYISQGAIDIKKSPLTRQSSEVRVHAINGKVVPNASVTRGGNVEDRVHFSKAEKALQQTLDKMPDHEKANLSIAADIAIDKSRKAKIIELNRGSHLSGFADPKFLASKGGPIAGAESVRVNQNIYKHITGRDSQLQAGIKGVGAGAGVAGATAGAQSYLEKKKRKDPGDHEFR